MHSQIEHKLRRSSRRQRSESPISQKIKRNPKLKYQAIKIKIATKKSPVIIPLK